MPRNRIAAGGLLAGVCLLLCAGRAHAVITKLTDLSDILDDATAVLTAKVEVLDASRPAMVLAVEKSLKGKPSFKKLPVLIKGDADSIKRKEAPQLLRRLAAKLPLVLFVMQEEEGLTVFGYTNGTWFRVDAVTVDKEVRGSFTALEPYLRRTYKGTTAELTDLLRNVLAGKRKAPKANAKEKPGLGPEVGKKGAWRGTERGERLVRNVARRSAAVLEDTAAERRATLPNWSVIPTVIVGGPLALLAMLFPTAFGGWRRWLVLLSVTATNSTLFTLQYCFATDLADSWWGTPQALWVCMTAVTVLGLAWAWWRHLSQVQRGEAPLLPSRVELLVLAITSLFGLAGLLALRYFKQAVLGPDWLPVLAFCLAMWGGTLYVAWRRLLGPRLVPALATEAVILTGLVLACTALGGVLEGRSRASGLAEGEEAASPVAAGQVRRVWTFRPPTKGQVVSAPLATGERVFVAVAHIAPFHRQGGYGTVYCLERDTGKVVWSFNDRKKMKIVYSSPCLADGRLYIGEGFHEDAQCKLYCLDPATGQKKWETQTSSHTESTPAVVGGRLYAGAGDDGLYCLDAATGKKLWNVPGYHIDASPVVAGGSVYVGCGVGDTFKDTAFLRVDSGSGKVQWRIAADLPVWGRAEVSGGRVFFGTSSTRTFEEEPGRGEVRCVRAEDGRRVWSRKLPGGVLGKLTLTRHHVYAGCRDGHLYCLRRKDGSVAWKYALGCPVEAGVALARCSGSELPTSRVYAVGGAGPIVCLGPNTGRRAWEQDLGSACQVAATPAIEERRDADGNWVRRLYVAATLASSGKVAELHCFEDTLEVEPGE
jgi:outer membrane protein assembly factor BamB